MLRTSAWAEGLNDAERALVLATASEKSHGPGEWVARAGDRVDHWIGVVDGFAKMSVASAEGRASTLTGVGAGVWFGEGSLIKHEPRRYDVLTLVATRVVLVPRDTFVHLRDTSIPFNHHLQDLMNARLSLFIGTLAHDRLLDTDARVAYCLGSLFDGTLYPHADRHVQIGQGEVGLLANVSRQRANVALRRLQSLGLLRIERSGLTVLDVDGLRRYAEAGGRSGGRSGGRGVGVVTRGPGRRRHVRRLEADRARHRRAGDSQPASARCAMHRPGRVTVGRNPRQNVVPAFAGDPRRPLRIDARQRHRSTL